MTDIPTMLTIEDIHEDLKDPDAFIQVFEQPTETLLPLINLLHVAYQQLLNTEAADMAQDAEDLMVNAEALLLALGAYPDMDRGDQT